MWIYNFPPKNGQCAKLIYAQIVKKPKPEKEGDFCLR